MKICKKILSVVLTAILLVFCTGCSGGDSNSAANIEESPASDFEYEYNPELGGVVINKYIGKNISVKIPSAIEKIDVVSIGKGAFKETDVAFVVIPNGVKEIGNIAFSYCTGLTSVTIPNSVTKIGNGAFDECTGLTSIAIPNSVTEIGEYAFCGCTGLTSVTIPDSITKIESLMFDQCTGLTSVTIPNSVTTIGGGAFRGCAGLTSITIPNSVVSIGGWAFDGCTANITYRGTTYTPDNYNALYIF